MTAIVPEVPTTAVRVVPRVLLHVDDVLGIADVSVHGPVVLGDVARLAAALSCRLHAAIDRAHTAVVVDFGGAPGCEPTDPPVARVLACARAGAASRGLTLDIV